MYKVSELREKIYLKEDNWENFFNIVRPTNKDTHGRLIGNLEYAHLGEREIIGTYKL